MWHRVLKRAFDIVLGSAALVLAAPVIAFAAVRVALDRDGPVVYAGRRVGLNGREFSMLKFRTMVTDADRIGGPNTPDDDNRLTNTGRLLRRYKLDELPQLINVLRGDMSLVGPRPQVAQEVAGYTVEERELLTVRPGITDRASLKFSNEGKILQGHSDPDLAYARLIRPEKMRLARRYVQSASLWEDIDILVATALLVLRHTPSAYTEMEDRNDNKPA